MRENLGTLLGMRFDFYCSVLQQGLSILYHKLKLNKLAPGQISDSFACSWLSILESGTQSLVKYLEALPFDNIAWKSHVTSMLRCYWFCFGHIGNHPEETC